MLESATLKIVINEKAAIQYFIYYLLFIDML